MSQKHKDFIRLVSDRLIQYTEKVKFNWLVGSEFVLSERCKCVGS